MVDEPKSVSSDEETTIEKVDEFQQTASSTHESEITNINPENNITKFQFTMVMFGVVMAFLLINMDATIVATTLPKVASEFGETEKLAWVGVSYVLTGTATQPFVGKLSDIFGRANVMNAMNSFFLIGSVICAMAFNMDMLIIGRAIQGLGGGMTPMAYILISDVVPLQQRSLWQSVGGVIYAISSLCAPSLGGFLADQVTWRWVYWINVPLCALAIGLIAGYLRLPIPKSNFIDKVKRVDFLGIFLLGPAIVLFLLAIHWGGTTFPWISVQVLLPIALSLPLFAGFLYVENKVALEPVIPHYVWVKRNFAINQVLSFAVGGGFYALSFYIPTIYQVVYQISATQSGVWVIAPGASGAIFTILSGIAISKTGIYRIWIVVGFISMALSTTLLGFVNSTMHPAFAIMFTLVGGVGLGCTLQPLLVVNQVNAPPEDMGAVSGLYTFVRSVGGTVTLSIMGTILNNETKRFLEPLSSKLDHSREVSFATVSTYPQPFRDELVNAYARGFSTMWFWYLVPVMVLSTVLSFFITHLPLQNSEKKKDLDNISV